MEGVQWEMHSYPSLPSKIGVDGGSGELWSLWNDWFLDPICRTHRMCIFYEI